jgi:hypothetical protein
MITVANDRLRHLSYPQTIIVESFMIEDSLYDY